MSYKDKEGQAQLCIVDLAHPSVHVDLSHWQAVGMQGTQTAQVHFDNTPIIPIGLPNCYLERPGFGMVLLVLRLVGMVPRYAWLTSYIKVAPLTQTHLKNVFRELAQQLSVTKQYFQYIAKLIDDEPALSHEREIRILRAQTEQCCQSVIQLVGKALGARPYCEEPTFSQLIADLPVFIRQSHAAFDYESIAELCLPEKSLWEL